MSLRLRLISAFLLIVLVTLAVVSITVRLGAERQVAVIRARGGWIGAEELIADLQAHYAENGSWGGVDSILQSHNLGSSSRGMGGPGGPGGQPGMGNRPGIRMADAQGNLVYDPEQSNPGAVSQSELNEGIAIESGGDIVGYLLPLQGQVFSGSDFETQILEVVNKATLYAALIAGGLALALALLLAYFVLRPVGQLTEAAADMASGDLGRRVRVQGGGELAALGGAFNHMASSLQSAEERRRAMTADIAHELRTPLSVQRANLEAMLDGVYPLEEENLQKVLEQNSLLTRLVQDLRTLSLAEAGELQLEKTSVQLNDLVTRLAARFQPQAERRGVRLSSQIASAPLSVRADPQRLEQILNNLLDNALRHTPSGGVVVVGLYKEGGSAVVRVQDSGPGIPQEALPHVFERFYRADRGRGREEGGSGLGLSIARKLAELQGGALSAANHPDGGAVFRLVLPFPD